MEKENFQADRFESFNRIMIANTHYVPDYVIGRKTKLKSSKLNQLQKAVTTSTNFIYPPIKIFT